MLGRFFLMAVFLMLSNVSGTRVHADPDFELNAKGLTLSGAIGRTMVGVTRDSSRVFSIYLGRDGKVDFTSSSGKKSKGSWRRVDSVTVCIKGLVAERPNDEVCKRAPQNGRGLDWMSVKIHTSGGTTTWSKETRGEHRGSSQIVYSFAGNVTVDRNSYVTDVTKWGGHLIVGRTLKDKEAWQAALSIDGKVDFVFASGRRFSGNYTLKAGEICMTFPDNPSTNGCRKPTQKDGKVLWSSSVDGGAVSEIVFMKRLEAPKPVIPPERPREAVLMTSKNVNYYHPSRGRHMLAAWDSESNRVDLWDGSAGRKIGGIPNVQNLVDVAWSQDDQILALVFANGLELFDTRTGQFLLSVKRRADQAAFREAAFLADRALVIGDDAGNLRVLSPDGETIMAHTAVGKGPVLDIAAHGQNKIAVAARDGFVGIFDSSLQVLPGLSLTMNATPSPLDISADGRWVTAPGQDGTLYVFDMTPDIATPVRSRKIPTKWLWNADIDTTRNAAVVALDQNEVVVVSLADFSIIERRGQVSGVVNRATILRGSDGLAVVTKSGRLAVWGRNESHSAELSSATIARKGVNARSVFETRRAAFTEGRRSAKPIEERASSDAAAYFNAGSCVKFDEMQPQLRLSARREDCTDQANRRRVMTQLDLALKALDCDSAADLARSISLNTSRLAQCRAQVKRNEDTRVYKLAKDAGDCDTVRGLSSNFNEPQAGPDCELANALKLETPRRMFLAAVQLDTAGDRKRAAELYQAVMSRFPEDDLALDAARRLTALADMEKQERENAAQAAQQAAAIKAAEERAKAAEAAAKRAADEAERQRKARDAEARRAEEANREAEAARQRAASQPQRNTACDHVYVGRVFETRGGVLRMMQSYRVVGVSQHSGMATVTGSGGYPQEVSCYDIPQ